VELTELVVLQREQIQDGWPSAPQSAFPFGIEIGFGVRGTWDPQRDQVAAFEVVYRVGQIEIHDERIAPNAPLNPLSPAFTRFGAQTLFLDQSLFPPSIPPQASYSITLDVFAVNAAGTRISNTVSRTFTAQ
jgi:hypothetical protein